MSSISQRTAEMMRLFRRQCERRGAAMITLAFRRSLLGCFYFVTSVRAYYELSA